MEITVDNLIKETGVDPELASLLLDFTNNDVEGAKKIIEAMPKDYSALKIRFMCHRTHYYGAMFILSNVRKKDIEEIKLLIDRKMEASNIDHHQEFEEFINAINRYIKNHNSDKEMENRILEEINSNNFKDYFWNCYNHRKDYFDINQLKSLFSEIFFRVLTESESAIKIEEERIDVFKYKKYKKIPIVKNKEEVAGESKDNSRKEYDKSEKNEKEKKDLKEETVVKVHNISLVLLKLEPVVSPVKGIAVSDLHVGDEVKVKIVDERDIGYYLNNLLGGRNENGELVPIKGIVKSIEKNSDTENYNVVVEFGPGIGGIMNLPGEIKILSPLNEELEKLNRAFNINVGVWIGIIIFIILFIVFVIITLSS